MYHLFKLSDTNHLLILVALKPPLNAFQEHQKAVFFSKQESSALKSPHSKTIIRFHAKILQLLQLVCDIIKDAVWRRGISVALPPIESPLRWSVAGLLFTCTSY